MKDIIQKLEELKTFGDRSSEDVRNQAIQQCIEVLESTPVIKAKALRKKGTDMWYYFSHQYGWVIQDVIYTISKDMLEFIGDSYLNLGDAELISISIIVKGGEE